MRRRRGFMLLWPIFLLSSWRILEQRVVTGLSSAGWTKTLSHCSTPHPPGATTPTATTTTTNHHHLRRYHHNWYTHEAAATTTTAAATESPTAATARIDDRRVVLLRRAMMIMLLVGTTTTTSCHCAMAAAAVRPVDTDGTFTLDDTNHDDQAANIRFVDITLSSPAESLGVEIGNDLRDGNVRIIRIINPSRSGPRLRERMIVQDVKSAKDLFDRLRNGPYPVTIRFISDDDNERSTTLATTTATAPTTIANAPTTTTNTDFASLSIVTTYRPVQCDEVAQRGDVLELVYEAYYIVVAGKGGRQEEIMYDASSWRGTGRPYQMVLGSGDMIPGVDQGLLNNMCVGERRILSIPKLLGHGPQSRRLFGIPDQYLGLKWSVELVRAESSSNKIVAREDE
jgi:hypothetical protein